MMRKPNKPSWRSVVLPSILLSGSIAFSPLSAGEAAVVDQGKKLAFDRKKGNCLACHAMGGGQAPGNIGPPLLAMKQRFPDKAKLRAQVYDATAINPHSRMPPFGKHQILSGDEIDKIAEYIHTL